MKKFIIIISLYLLNINVYSQERGLAAGLNLIPLNGIKNEIKLVPSFNFGVQYSNFIFDIGIGVSNTYSYEESNGMKTFGQTIYVGPNGGHYYINSNGNKIYVGRDKNSSTYTTETFKNYELYYITCSFDIAYKLKYKKMFIAPNIGILSIDATACPEYPSTNISKSSMIFGALIGVSLKNSDIYAKLTNRSFGLYYNLKIKML